VKLKHVVGNGNIDVNVNQAIVSRKGYNDRKEAQRKEVAVHLKDMLNQQILK
jgi:hypothetical protein